MLVAVVGPSGAGKDTLMAGARAALADDPRFLFARRCITRPAEAGGEDHEPLGEAEFEARPFMLAWRAHGLRYGVPAEYAREVEAGRVVLANLSRGVLAEATSRWRLRVLLITAPAETLAARLAARGREDAADVAARLARDMALPPGLDVATVINDASVEEGVARVLAALSRAAADARR